MFIPGLSLRTCHTQHKWLTVIYDCWTTKEDPLSFIVDCVSFLKLNNRSRIQRWYLSPDGEDRGGVSAAPEQASVLYLQRKSVRCSELACSVCSLFSHHQGRRAKLWKCWLLHWVTFSFPRSCSLYYQPPAHPNHTLWALYRSLVHSGQKVQLTAFLMSLWHSTSNKNASDYDMQWRGGQVEILWW